MNKRTNEQMNKGPKDQPEPAKLARFNAEIDADLLHRARIKAATEKVTFREIAEQALLDFVSAPDGQMNICSDESEIGKFTARVPKWLIKRAKIKALERGETFEMLAELWLREYISSDEQMNIRTNEHETISPEALATLRRVSQGLQSLMAQIEKQEP